MATCPKCHTLNPQGERICLACGAGLTDQSATAVESTGTTCPNGHPIDPSWSKCPYCTREQAAGPIGSPKVTVIEDDVTQPLGADALRSTSRTRLEADSSAPVAGGGPPPSMRQTRLEGEPGPPPPVRGPSPPPAGPRRTRLEGAGPGPQIPAVPDAAPGPASGALRPTRLEPSISSVKRHTVLQDEAPGPRAEAPPPSAAPVSSPARVPPPQTGDGRKLVAVLGAPGLGPGGVVFPVRSGKNFIGADPASEICLSQDQEVSSEHALILYRAGVFYLADRMSTNGTWINGEEVDATSSSVVLRDRDRIRCGMTELVFLAIDPSASDSEADPTVNEQ